MKAEIIWGDKNPLPLSSPSLFGRFVTVGHRARQQTTAAAHRKSLLEA